MKERLHILRDQLDARLPRLKDFLRLTRFDRPIGTYLLLWPTLTALWIAAEGWPGWHLFTVFVLGTFLTRSAGCVVNDMTDRDFDGGVKRTMERPLVTGHIDLLEAGLLAAGLAFVALLLVLTTNLGTVLLAFAGAAVAVAYPFMKRLTYLPQAVLGVAFSFGIPMSFTAATGEIPNVAWLLVIANLLWVVAYDTQYAMVDRDDDLRLGIKSTAILFADLDKIMIGVLQVATLFTLVLAARSAELSFAFYAGILAAAGLFTYQQFLIRFRQRQACFNAFLNNHWVGLAVFAGTIVHYLLN